MQQLLFIHGIKGSELYENENKRWFPKNTEDLKSLGINNPLEAVRPIRSINAFFLLRADIYKGILDNFSPEEIEYHAYDWRQSLDTLVDPLGPAIRIVLQL